MRKAAKGFTLIELLIVIAVLGILAVAVLSAINPVEQINRSRDTGSRSDAEQLLGAMDRYYANNGFYVWKQSASNPASDATAWAIVDNAWTDGATAVLTKLSVQGTGELKASFTTRIVGTSYNRLYKYNRGNPGDSTYVCFNAQSSQFSTEAWVRCGSNVNGNGLPADLQPVASSICLGAALKNYSCLP
jgi:prepilin-type N-terminal cleavage/methylation domain-containing protein